METVNRLKECLHSIGVIFEEDKENFLLSDVVEDSLMFVTLITEIEQEFEIEIPDEYIVPGRLASFKDLVEMVEELSAANE